MNKTSSKDAKQDREVPGVALLYKAFRVMDAVAEAKTPPRITDLLAATDLSKGTLYRLLQALVDRRYLRHDPSDQSYRLGTKLFDMAHTVWESFDLRSAASSELIALRDRLGETTRLSVLEGYNVLYIDQVDAVSELRVASAVGSRAPIHASSSGKAMLSKLEPVQRSEILSRLELTRLTPATITDEKELRQHIDLVTARGYAISMEERVPGIASVSAPILDASNRPVGALTVTGPSFRLEWDKLNAIGRDLIDSARRIAGNAGMYTQPFSVSTPPRPKETIPDEVSCAYETRAIQGEGPLWVPELNVLYWVNILEPSLNIFNPDLKHNKVVRFPCMLSAVAHTRTDRLLVATQKGVQLLDLQSHKLTPFSNPEPRLGSNRLNDAKVDRAGRLWVGSMAMDGTPGHGSLYSISGDGIAVAVDTGFAISNGIAWSPDNKFMYFIDSGRNQVFRYEFDLESGEIGRRDVLIDVPQDSGRPGGLTVDRDGFLWVAHYDGWAINRYQPDGKIDKRIPLPVPRPTSCMFGGPDLQDLFVTSARIRLSSQRLSEAPLSGSLFRIRTTTSGIAETPFEMN